jgi:2,3-bisphosphoglycerate-dependent phosphoglycerate mutase
MKIYFARHGESVANLLQEFSNRGVKHGLTEAGRQQASDLAQGLKCASIARIYSSPLLRAAQTAQIIARELKIPWEAADALREFDVGILEGHSDAVSWQVFGELLSAWLERGEWDRRIDQGESFINIQQRFMPFVERLLRHDRPADYNLLLVGHGGLYLCMLPLIMMNIDHRSDFLWHLKNTHLVVAELRPEGLICLSWGDVQFDR